MSFFAPKKEEMARFWGNGRSVCSIIFSGLGFDLLWIISSCYATLFPVRPQKTWHPRVLSWHGQCDLEPPALAVDYLVISIFDRLMGNTIARARARSGVFKSHVYNAVNPERRLFSIARLLVLAAAHEKARL
jgi:hypothetical protein